MTHDSELVERLRAGLEGTTKGQWRQCGGMSAAYRAIHSPAGYIVFGMADAKVHTEQGKPIQAPGWDEQDRNARHIANCSPDNIRTLLDTVDSLRARLAEIEGENARLAAEASKHAHDAETVRRERDAAEETVRELREGLLSDWQGVVLDGRNEHGSHVLKLPQRSIELEQAENGDFLKEHAEKILQASEALGFQIGAAVVATFSLCTDEGFFSHYEFEGVSLALTELIYGAPEDQIRRARSILKERNGG